jgi:RNA-directed DNA polymerase
MGRTKSNKIMRTKLDKITKLSSQNTAAEFNWLMPHFKAENLISCFNELDGNKAIGTDGLTKADYAENLEENIQELIGKMKTLTYRPQPTREVLIPKGEDKFRTLNISVIEDKIIQLMFSKILEAIYEPIFCECSYGFRKNRSTHMAIKDTIGFLKFNNVKKVIDIDLENFFGTIRHDKLLEMLSLKIKDKLFLRYISRILKAGVNNEQNKREQPYRGLGQGSILSPILANIYAHYAIDLWITKRVPKYTIGNIGLFRYSDDLILCCTDTRDQQKLLNSFAKRLDKFGLKLNSIKTKTINFNRYEFERGMKQESFDFLGFTFFLSRALKGGFVTIKVKTSKKTLRSKLANVKQWLKQNRFKGGMLTIWQPFCRKLQGHIAYFGVTNNGRSVTNFLQKSRRLFFKWMNRRSQKRSISWEKFSIFEKQYPLPKVLIYHQLY